MHAPLAYSLSFSDKGYTRHGLLLIRLLIIVVALWLSACQLPNHYLIHPRQVPEQVIAWSEDFQSGQLLIHLEWARPAGSGSFPTVLVHPEGGKTALEMKGVIWDLAHRGYVAIAADYKRLIDGEYRRNTFAWRENADVTAALKLISDRTYVDQRRIATLGFSQGGVFSLMIAAHAPDRIKAVVAYYPVTDFEYWLNKHRPNPIQRLVYRIISWHFRRESGAETEEQFRNILRRASPLCHAKSIRAPVLLIHGDRDKAASAEESRRLADRLTELGREVKLMVVPGAVHIFNFRQPEKAALAWEATLQWLERHLRTDTPASSPPHGQLTRQQRQEAVSIRLTQIAQFSARGRISQPKRHILAEGFGATSQNGTRAFKTAKGAAAGYSPGIETGDFFAVVL